MAVQWKEPTALIQSQHPPQITQHNNTNNNTNKHRYTHICTESCYQQFQAVTILQQWVKRLCRICTGLSEVARLYHTPSIWRGCVTITAVGWFEPVVEAPTAWWQRPFLGCNQLCSPRRGWGASELKRWICLLLITEQAIQWAKALLVWQWEESQD